MSINDYIVLQKIGQGSFGIVQKVLQVQQNRQYALKTVKYGELKQKNKKNAINQVHILASLDHPNIIKHKESFFENGEEWLCTVMELAPNGDLASRIKHKKQNELQFTESQIWSIGKDIINGITALHENHIMHRDIKPANILFGHQQVAKIGDMNVSVQMTEDYLNSQTQTGTPYYASPEIWNHEPYGLDCDIWSFGCVLYEMCTLSKPFQGKNLDRLFRKVMTMKYRPISYRYSYNLTNVIEKCLTSKHKRATAHELKRIFEYCTSPKFENIRSCINLQSGNSSVRLRTVNPEEKEYYIEDITVQNTSILDRFLKPERNCMRPSYNDSIKSLKYLNNEPQPYRQSFLKCKTPTYRQNFAITSTKPSIIEQIEKAQSLIRSKYLKTHYLCP